LNLLDLSRIEAGVFTICRTKVNVAEIVRNCVVIEQHAASIRSHDLLLDLPHEELFVMADPNALRRVLCSLVENSIKYTPDGGRITLSAESKGEAVVIRVSDTGCGIEASDVPHVFEKFYRGRPSTFAKDLVNSESSDTGVPGIGLGLYLAHTIIEEFNGRMYIDVSDNHGTTVAVHLPLLLEKGESKREQLVEASTHC
jgi:signal transduction histidine kinase